MTKHILDRNRRRKAQARLNNFSAIERRMGFEGPDRLTHAQRRRAKGKHNPALQLQAYLAIERGLIV